MSEYQLLVAGIGGYTAHHVLGDQSPIMNMGPLHLILDEISDAGESSFT